VRRIDDEFSCLRGRTNNNYIHTLRRKAKGLCVACNSPRVTANHCLEHAVRQREYQRKGDGSKARRNTLTYRLEAEGK
jgi:hypothetical protein